MSAKHRAAKAGPPKSSGQKVENATSVINYNKSTIRFCLNHLQSGFSLDELPQNQRADLAMALYRRRSFTWDGLLKEDRHGLGMEHIPGGQLKTSIPRVFEGQEKFMVFRYSKLLPMVGVRTNDTFHIVWIERHFGELYDHGN